MKVYYRDVLNLSREVLGSAKNVSAFMKASKAVVWAFIKKIKICNKKDMVLIFMYLESRLAELIQLSLLSNFIY